jgi:hypothetical protein
MDVETVTIDAIGQRLLRSGCVIARERASQMRLLREVDWRQAPAAAGCRSLREWVAGRLDVASETARDLVATTYRLVDLPDVEDAVAAGEIGFDRAVAVGRFAGRDDTADILNNLAGYDVAGIRRLAAKRRRMSRVDEECVFRGRYLVVQPNIDESAWQLNGRLPGFVGRIVIQALEAKADTFPAEPDTGRGLLGVRMRCGRSASTPSPA